MLKRLLVLFVIVSCNGQQLKPEINYPSIENGDFSETIHGQQILDPYKNLEDLADSKVLDWFNEQNILAESWLDKLPRTRFLNKFLKYENVQDKVVRKLRFKENGSYFYLSKDKEDGVQKLYYKKHLDSNETLLFDPNSYNKEHIISYFKVSWDNQKIAINLVKKGEKNGQLYLYDMKTKNVEACDISGLSPGFVGNVSWLRDNSGFFYTHIPHFRYEDPTYLLNTVGTFYKIGSKGQSNFPLFSKAHNKHIPFQTGDVPIISIADCKSSYITGALVNTDNYSDTYYSSIFQEFNVQKINWQLLFSKKEKISQYYIVNDYLIYRTAKNSPNFKICRTPLKSPNFNNPEVLVPEYKDEVISDFEYLNENVYYTTKKNGVEAKMFVLSKNHTKELELPFKAGSSSLFSRGEKLFVTISGWTAPISYFKYDLESELFENVGLSNTNHKDFEKIKIEEIEIESWDGTKVPVSILFGENLKKNGMNRTLIYTYGAYGVSFSPRFFIPFLSWVNEGGIVVFPHVRGGGEKGNHWYEDGKKTKKANTWKDLIACAEYLIKKKYTSQQYLVNYGLSAGGIAVGKSLTERPDLFKVGIMDSPALNMLRYEFQPNGKNNMPEFGTVNDSIEFQALKEMDSYHSLKVEKEYPAIMIKVGMNDGSVTPWDPAKFIARAQNMTKSVNPLLLSVDFDGGHGGDGTYEGLYRNMSDFFAFALWQTGHPEFQPQ